MASHDLHELRLHPGATWDEAMKFGVPTGTLEALEGIARQPESLFESLAAQAGFRDGEPGGAALTPREFELAGWTIRLR